jgi:hypothetical protein
MSPPQVQRDDRDAASPGVAVHGLPVLGGLPDDHGDAGHLRGAAVAAAGHRAPRDGVGDPHKLRRAMVNPERASLTGAVEVDECTARPLRNAFKTAGLLL